jgi:hypothetical protein
MLDEVLAKQGALGIPNRPVIGSFDAACGTGDFVAALLEREILPHMPLQAAASPEEIPTWSRPARSMDAQRKRRERVKVARARNRVREEQRTRGYVVSRKLRIRSEHVCAETKVRHGMDRARLRGRRQVEVQAELTAVVPNLKRLAAFRGRKPAAAARAHFPRPSGTLPRSLSAPRARFGHRRLRSLRS